MVVFLIDIVVCFLSSYTDVATGDQITDARKIAYSYVCGGTFLIDILSTFPLKEWGKRAGASTDE